MLVRSKTQKPLPAKWAIRALCGHPTFSGLFALFSLDLNLLRAQWCCHERVQSWRRLGILSGAGKCCDHIRLPTFVLGRAHRQRSAGGGFQVHSKCEGSFLLKWTPILLNIVLFVCVRRKSNTMEWRTTDTLLILQLGVMRLLFKLFFLKCSFTVSMLRTPVCTPVTPRCVSVLIFS